MKVILQKVKYANVRVEDKEVAKIRKGYCLLVGVHKDSTEEDAKFIAQKIVNSRLFEDEQGKLNLSIKEVGGEILSVSQFTLYADTTKGRRPSFQDVAKQEKAKFLYDRFNEYLKNYGITVETGIFRSHMELNIINEGPVTVTYERISKL